jgi:hypothetical protein
MAFGRFSILAIIMCFAPIGSQGFIVRGLKTTRQPLLFRDHRHQSPPIVSIIHPSLSIRSRPRHIILASLSLSSSSASSSFYLTRIVFLRALSFVYFIAFTVALRQNKALIGDTGITPARFELLEARERSTDRRTRRAKWIKDLLGDDRKRSPWTNLKLSNAERSAMGSNRSDGTALALHFVASQ